MIGYLRGTLAAKGDGYIIIDINGVGWQVTVPSNTGAFLSSEGQEVTVYTTMVVREDDISLFGFSGSGELDAFKKLTSVSGVGPKAAISILSSFSLEELHQAIVFEDKTALTRANGIGKKTAERILLELKDKFSPEDFAKSAGGVSSSEIPSVPSDGRGEALNALMALGYTRAEASGALSTVRDNDVTAEEYIMLALKNLF